MTLTQSSSAVQDGDADLGAALAGLLEDWNLFSARLSSLDLKAADGCPRLTLRLHYPCLRDAEATVGDFVDAITLMLSHFCLPRAEVRALQASRATLGPFKHQIEVINAHRRAVDLFIRAQAESNRNGEAGELILFLLTEWILEAPQIVAKMSLKTSSAMPVHGADGIHVRFDAATGRLTLFSGEAKLHKSLAGAVRSAVESIGHAASHAARRHELDLVQRNLSLSGLDEASCQALLGYLDPFGPTSNDRVDAVTCLIGFDFKGYGELVGHGHAAEAAFRALAAAELERAGTSFAKALADAGLAGKHIELFLLPLPSVADLRDLFQERIGWQA